MSGKKLLNTVDRCVDECLEGLVAVNPGLRLIKDTRVVVRADIDQVKQQGKVTLLSGGGSGHEPAHAGYVGCGMLSASVAGSIFTSPPPAGILTGLRAIAKDNPGGCFVIVPNYTGDRLNFGIGIERGMQEGLSIMYVTVGEDCARASQDKSAGRRAGAMIIVKNYTGDRINFGLALERAKAEGMSCDMVVIGEDCALASHDKTAGRRGLGGTVFIHKIAGALAEEGQSLSEVTKYAQEAANNMGTIGLALAACSTPGSTGPLFQLHHDEMELGLGLHGEAGVKRVKLLSAKDTVKLMIDHMTNPDNSTHLPVQKGAKVACMINNLGALSVLELNIITNETIKYLEDVKGVSVIRVYCGTYVTSLEMAGVSISLLHLNDTFIRCLDAPTTAPAWQRPLLGPGQTDRCTPQPMEPELGTSSHTHAAQGATVDKATGERIYDMISCICERLSASEEKLNSLDSESGDGDCGSTMARGAQYIRERLGSKTSPGLPVNNPYLLSLEIANIVETYMGGSSGGLYSLFFTGAAAALQKEISGQSWLQALVNGIAAIQKYGGAEPGDRTMLDALWATKETFKEKLVTMSTVDAFKAAVQATEVAAEGTKTMKARAGRASYVSADLLTKPDPGAIAVSIWLRAVADTLV